MAPIISSLSGLYKSFISSGASGGLSVVASGGAVTEYQDGSNIYRLHTFAYDQNFTYTSGPGNIDVLVVAGGGAGGRTGGDQDTGKGGAGAGGVAFALNIPIADGTTCGVVVGDGAQGFYTGSGYAGRSAANTYISGDNSTFTIPSGPHTITAIGGGAGGVGDNNSSYPVSGVSGNTGAAGGSGGGAGCRSSGPGDYSGGPGTQPSQNPGMPWVSNYGNPGGNSTPSSNNGGGGGGGAGGAGSNHAGSGVGGAGGAGTSVLGTLSAAETALFLSNSYIGTLGSLAANESINTSPNGRVKAGNTTTTYIAGGGSGGSAPGGAIAGGKGGGGTGSAGLNYGQSAVGPLSPLANHPQSRGLDYSGGGGGGSADDPFSGNSGPGVGLPSGINGGGGKGVVVVRYLLDKTDLTTEADTYISATGGTVTTDGDYKIHTFTHPNPTNYGNNHSDTFAISQLSSDPLLNTVHVLVVGGGGSGGCWYGAGGGAGGVAESYQYSIPNAGSAPLSIPVQVGIGGQKILGPQPNGQSGLNGGDSHFGPATQRILGIGGGGGSFGGGSSKPNGGDGGSGGGGGQSSVEPARPGRGTQQRVTTSVNNTVNCFNYGFPGGYAQSASSSDAGGGGGAGGAGGNAGNSGVGGTGMSSSITGSSVAYAGGGGGANASNSNSGGSGGGGGFGGGNNATNGTPGLGGGGGGSYSSANSGDGGSGVVIVRYKYQ